MFCFRLSSPHFILWGFPFHTINNTFSFSLATPPFGTAFFYLQTCHTTLWHCFLFSDVPRHTLVPCFSSSDLPHHTLALCFSSSDLPCHTLAPCFSSSDLPRHTIFFDVVDFAYNQRMTPRLKQEIPLLMSRPVTQEVQVRHIQAISKMRWETGRVEKASNNSLVLPTDVLKWQEAKVPSTLNC